MPAESCSFWRINASLIGGWHYVLCFLWKEHAKLFPSLDQYLGLHIGEVVQVQPKDYDYLCTEHIPAPLQRWDCSSFLALVNSFFRLCTKTILGTTTLPTNTQRKDRVHLSQLRCGHHIYAQRRPSSQCQLPPLVMQCHHLLQTPEPTGSG